MSDMSVPAGFEQINRNSHFSNLTGPYYGQLSHGSVLKLRMQIQEKHLNKLGVAHGGALMTLADNALTDAVAEAFEEPVSVVTVTLNTEFLSPAKLGEWVESETRILRKGGRLLVADCLLSVEGRTILHATAVMARVPDNK